MNRLVVIGSVIADQLMTVPRLPDRGGDVLAGPVATQAGGAFNIAAAAVRLGLPTALCGRVGTGPLGVLLIGALADAQGPRLAITAMALIGLAALTLVLLLTRR